MTSKNDITGDLIATKVTSNSYRDNYDAIFRKEQKLVDKILSEPLDKDRLEKLAKDFVETIPLYDGMMMKQVTKTGQEVLKKLVDNLSQSEKDELSSFFKTRQGQPALDDDEYHCRCILDQL